MASSSESGGRMEATRRASIVLPVPGGPIISTLCPPAAAISRPRLACAWPRTSAKSRPSPSLSRGAPARAVGGADLPLAVQVLDRVVQGGDGNDVDAFHHAGLRRVHGGHQQRREAFPPRVQGHRQHPAHRAHPGVERQLAHHERAVEPSGLDQPDGGEDADRGRQIEGGAFLADVGGRQVDRDAVDGELEARVPDGGADPVAALAHGRVGKTDGAERGQARGDVHLDEDGGGLDPVERGGADPREHRPSVGTRAGPVNVPESIRARAGYPVG